MLAILSFAALTLVTTAAVAQEYSDDVCPAKPQAEKRAQRWAGRWFAKGELAAKETRFQEALDAFLCSLYLYPHQNTVFNVAQLTSLVEDKTAVTATIKTFREEHPGSDFDDELADLIASLEKAQGIEPPAEAAEPPAEAAAGAPVEAPVVVAPVEAAAEPGPDAEAPPEMANAGGADEGTKGASRGKALRTTGWVAIGAAGATLVVGIILQAAAGAAQKDAEAATDYDAFRRNEDDMKSRQGGATAMFVMTGVFAGAGALMVALGRQKKETDSGSGAQVSISPAPAGVVLTGRF
jgi:hypothetical protein